MIFFPVFFEADAARNRKLRFKHKNHSSDENNDCMQCFEPCGCLGRELSDTPKNAKKRRV
jgi:hypothetical protein